MRDKTADLVQGRTIVDKKEEKRESLERVGEGGESVTNAPGAAAARGAAPWLWKSRALHQRRRGLAGGGAAG